MAGWSSTTSASAACHTAVSSISLLGLLTESLLWSHTHADGASAEAFLWAGITQPMFLTVSLVRILGAENRWLDAADS